MNEIDKLKKKNAELESELQILKSQILFNKEKVKKRRKFIKNVFLRIGLVFIGRDLRKSYIELFDEWPNLSKDKIIVFSANLLARITGTTILGIFIAFLPTLLLLLDSFLLFNQNQLFRLQNEQISKQTDKITIQTELLESNRRSSYVFLMNNVLDQVASELKGDWNGDKIKNLSPEITSRIIALSHAFKPYRYLEKGRLIDASISPERGQLLITLLSSGIDSVTLSIIYRNGNFTYSDLRNTNLENAYLDFINLAGSNLSGTFIYGTSFKYAILNNCDISYIRTYTKPSFISFGDDGSMISTEMNPDTILFSDFSHAELKNVNLSGSTLYGFNFSFAQLSRANFSNSTIEESIFYISQAENVSFDSTIFKRSYLHGMTNPQALGNAILDSMTWYSLEYYFSSQDSSVIAPQILNYTKSDTVLPG
ncbi:MAG: pentapeptide repeat-containing protein [Bacteroidota bacterium]